MKEKLIEILNENNCYGCDKYEYGNCSDSLGDCNKILDLHPDSINELAARLYERGVLIIPETGIGDLSDGYHTFNELYHHRAVLFSVICNACPEKAWKSKLHDTGDMFEGMFIVGIETPQGQATYHYDIDPYWDMFKVKELERAPKWDGHTPQDAIERIGSIEDFRIEAEWIYDADDNEFKCSRCGRAAPLDAHTLGAGYVIQELSPTCPTCNAKMKTE